MKRLKSIFILLVLFSFPGVTIAQLEKLDSLATIIRIGIGKSQTTTEEVAIELHTILEKTKHDSIRFIVFKSLNLLYEELNMDSSFYYTEKCVEIARANNQKRALAAALYVRGLQFRHAGKYADALKDLLEAFRIIEDRNSEKDSWTVFNRLTPGEDRRYILAVTHHIFALLMESTGNLDEEIFHYQEEIKLAKEIDSKFRLQLAYMNLINAYERLGKLDSALIFADQAEALAEATEEKLYLGWTYSKAGNIHKLNGDLSKARDNYYLGIKNSKEVSNLSTLMFNYFELSTLYILEANKDSSLHYSLLAYDAFKKLGSWSIPAIDLGKIYQNIQLSYSLNNQVDSTFKYMELALRIKEELYTKEINNLAEFQKLTFGEQQRLQQLENERISFRTKLRTYGLASGLGVFLIIALLLYRNNKQKNRANQLLKQGKEEIENTLSQLKATQSQLIHSEKMASLGELTAGIAHEIQNPLNFVNNFSEVNKELIEELNEELDDGNIIESRAIANDIRENETKIMFHGKRAEAIVKGMLQHSRSNNGKKELVDINALADEYLRLAYHGLRAKDKSFNAQMVTEFDDNVIKVNVVPQEIGRVLLNLITNAFYAVNEKQQNSKTNYQPTVIVGSKIIENNIVINIKDNGNGIPQEVIEKIFQPFFTTKPTGEGTGLGLSMSYDIITKGHGGHIEVDSQEGQGSEFKIILPL